MSEGDSFLSRNVPDSSCGTASAFDLSTVSSAQSVGGGPFVSSLPFPQHHHHLQQKHHSLPEHFMNPNAQHGDACTSPPTGASPRHQSLGGSAAHFQHPVALMPQTHNPFSTVAFNNSPTGAVDSTNTNTNYVYNHDNSTLHDSSSTSQQHMESPRGQAPSQKRSRSISSAAASSSISTRGVTGVNQEQHSSRAQEPSHAKGGSTKKARKGTVSQASDGAIELPLFDESSGTTNDCNEDAELKLSRKRESNNEAVRKCRIKRKTLIQQHEETVANYEAKIQQLTDVITMLVASERSAMKMCQSMSEQTSQTAKHDKAGGKETKDGFDNEFSVMHTNFAKDILSDMEQQIQSLVNHSS
eukprot:Nk52_evm10s165 gene=Nk52_evmTU10s165